MHYTGGIMDKKLKTKKSHKGLIITISTIVAVLGITLTAFFSYVGNYYRADESVQEIIDSDDDITLNSSNDIVFNADSDTGIVFYPGGLVEYTAYVPLLKKIMDSGISCILVDMPYNLALLDSNAANAYIENITDISHWYIAGHSLGGAFGATYAASNLDKLDGLIMLASYETKDISESDLDVMCIYGSEDGVLNLENYEDDKVNLPSSYVEHIIEGGNHGYFGDYGEQSGDGVATITREEQQVQTANYIYQFINE